jgi:Mg/Co/Ni transporter MgtE
MLKLTEFERQVLIGPLVVGCVLGAFVGLASWGFDSEYSRIHGWRMALNASGWFSAALAIATLPLGILPIVTQRFGRRHGSTADGEGR